LSSSKAAAPGPRAGGAPSPGVSLKPGRDGPIRKRHHPWIYSQAIADPAGASAAAEYGDPLPVRSADGAVLGWGLYSPESLIAVRMISFGPEEPPADWLEQRLHAAKNLRDALGIDSDAMRLVNAEGDSLPGLVIDRYGDTAVVSVHARAMEGRVEAVAGQLGALFPSMSVYLKRDEHYARVEKLHRPSGYLRGSGEGVSVIKEAGTRLRVDFAQGQKTGYYLDQRENRSTIARCSAGRSVLNLFSYTGAVALRAAAAGARRIVSVDSSRRALEIGRESVKLNPTLDEGLFSWVQEDVFTYLEDNETWDLVVADPPPFARRRVELDGALKGYLSLFQRCLALMNPGGIGFFFSCSGAVDRPTFQQVVVEAALHSGRKVRLLRELHADVDHPVAAAHPEGEYLKGWMVHAE
jgi:23S rRNA (cytosine1962-C5)-methyltransferase